MNQNLGILLALSIAVSCTPVKQDADECADGEVYSPALRRCIDANLLQNTPPSPAANQVVTGFAQDQGPGSFAVNPGFDLEGDPLSYEVTTNVQNGTLSGCMDLAGSGGPDDLLCTYEPDPGFYGNDIFYYRIFDGNSYSTVAHVTITVSQSLNSPPVPAVQATVLMDRTATSTTASVAPGTDPDGDPLTYHLVNLPDNGTLTNCMGLGSSTSTDLDCTYTLNDPYFWGTDTFSYRIFDTKEYSQTATITIEVNNNAYSLFLDIVDASFSPPPTALYDAYDYQPNLQFIDYNVYGNNYPISTSEVTPFNYQWSIQNATSPECDWLIIDLSNGHLSGIPDSKDHVGTCSFDLQLENVDLSTTATISSQSILITNTNDSPQIEALNNFVSTATQDDGPSYTFTATVLDLDLAGGISGEYVVWEFYSPDNTCDFLEFSPSNGVSTDPNGDIIIRAQASRPHDEDVAMGSCTLALRVRDALGEYSNMWQETLLLDNIAPVLNPTSISTATVAQGEIIEIEDADINVDLPNQQGIGNAQYTWDTTDCDDIGTLTATNSTTGAFSFTPNDDPYYNRPVFSGSCFIQTTFTDNSLDSATATITLNYSELNDPPRFVTASEAPAAITINYGAPPYTFSFRVDEGGWVDNDWVGPEDVQQVQIDVATSNPTLLPLTGIQLSSSDTGAVQTATTTLTIDSTATEDSAQYTVTVTITPAGGYAGPVDLTFTISDNGAADPTYEDLVHVINIEVNDILAVHKGWQSIQAHGKVVNSSDGQQRDAQVYLAWNEMDIYLDGSRTASAQSGWNIYRKVHTDPDFDFQDPLAHIDEADPLEFLDTQVEPGEVYTYTVLPADTDQENIYVLASTAQAEIRVVIPPDNMVLVHRLMANKAVCQLLDSPSDFSRYNRCAYSGAGESPAGFYDIGRDFLITAHEAGCNFTTYSDSESGCDGAINGCIGSTTPSDTMGDNGEMYYDRSEGRCYAKAGGSWQEINTFAPGSLPDYRDVQRAHLPPMVFITKAEAQDHCQNITLRCGDGNNCTTKLLETLRLHPTNTASIPSRKQFVAASTWAPTLTASADIEAGEDYDYGNNYCNSIRANGIIYLDSDYPGPSFLDGLPFTDSANEKALRTHSDASEVCQSQFGARDLIGNVKEWNLESIDCSADPCEIASDPDGNFPVDYPITASTAPSSTTDYPFYTLAVGTPSTTPPGVDTGLYSAIFNDDGVYYDGTITAAGFAAGGSYDNSNPDYTAGERAGIWALDIIDINTTRADVGFRCSIWLRNDDE